MARRTLVLALAGAFATTAALADPPSAPSRFDVLAALQKAARVPLARGQACRDVVGAPVHRPTLGDWIAYNLSLFEGPSTIAIECRPASGRAVFECDVEFRTEQGTESPWSWGVRARFRRQGGTVRMVPGDFTCIGAG
jgi:hypothetical protein